MRTDLPADGPDLFETVRVVSPWDYLQRARTSLAASEPVEAFRNWLREGDRLLQERFLADEQVEDLVLDRARLVDLLLTKAWERHLPDERLDLCLVAVGGYGRGELLPHSDIDIMILLPKTGAERWTTHLEGFLTFLWDIGLEVGHSVRTVDECKDEALADISVATTLIEARLLAGPDSLFTAMRRAIAPDRIWSSADFFEAKLAEQVQRHHRYHDTAYNLEPNVKQSPGGLRDIQTVAWVAKRHFGADTLDELVQHGFLTQRELVQLKAAQAYLWRVRFALHLLTDRREDRILFDHQIKLARQFGYEDATFTLAVEQFMQRYYRTAMFVSLTNELLLQHFREAILASGDARPVPISPLFQEREEYLEVTSPDVFVRNPSALLELFVVLQNNPQLRGVRAGTIRLVTRHLWLIDEEFRQNPRNHRLFLEVLRAPAGVTHELRRMNLYGVLGRYIPAFGRIVGRMQYDLFHAYTVDAHTLFVVANLRRLALERYDHELPKLSQVFRSLPRPEVPYLAALFHDIAKGRGGDHSDLGATDAEAFCLEQGMSRYDARLVSWLVRNHLALSMTAQKQDISDPDVVNAFARLVGDQAHLDHLYVLTVADVRGTNPKLWNSWKASLFDDFYELVKQALRRGLESPIDREVLIASTQSAARELLAGSQVSADRIGQVWGDLDDDYFLRHDPQEVAWHTGLLARRQPDDHSVLVAATGGPQRGGATAVLVHTYRRRHSFARATAALDQMGLTIMDARITPTREGSSLDSYYVLEGSGAPVSDPDRLTLIESTLRRVVSDRELSPQTVTRRVARQLKVFSTRTGVSFSRDSSSRWTILELVAADRPGLLSEIGKVLWQQGLNLLGAKIMTVGERAEDVFYLTDGDGSLLTPERQQVVTDALIAALDRRGAAA